MLLEGLLILILVMVPILDLPGYMVSGLEDVGPLMKVYVTE
jgi:hypothetical protein